MASMGGLHDSLGVGADPSMVEKPGLGRRSPDGVTRRSPDGVTRRSPDGVTRRSPDGVTRRSPDGSPEGASWGRLSDARAASRLAAYFSSSTSSSRYHSRNPGVTANPVSGGPNSESSTSARSSE